MEKTKKILIIQPVWAILMLGGLIYMIVNGDLTYIILFSLLFISAILMLFDKIKFMHKK